MKRDTSFGKKMKKYTETFLSFLQKVMATYPTGKLGSGFGQCPDSSCKAASAVSTEAQKNRLELVYLPPHSPQLNIVEGLWNTKSSVINNVFYSAASKSVCGPARRDKIMKHPHAIIDRLCVRL
ncbi:transposase [Paenibacillus larvae]|uniref:transposase n=1 Tax=Paenibacillus larvae TaxID=1464 RepID=UPI0037C96C7D